MGVEGIEPSTSFLSGTRSTTEPHAQNINSVFNLIKKNTYVKIGFALDKYMFSSKIKSELCQLPLTAKTEAKNLETLNESGWGDK